MTKFQVKDRPAASGRSRSSAAEYAVERVQAEGFALPRRPSEDVPGLPDDITSLSDIELMEAMREQTAWLEYAGYRLARGEIEERELELEINQLLAIRLSGERGGNERVSIAKAQAESDPEIQELRQRHMQAQAYRKLVGNLRDASERRITLVSRELTRRTSMEPASRRAHKFSGA